MAYKPKFYFIKDIRQLTGRTTLTIVRWCERGIFPKPRMIMRRRTWLAAQVDKWMEEQSGQWKDGSSESTPTIFPDKTSAF